MNGKAMRDRFALLLMAVAVAAGGLAGAAWAMGDRPPAPEERPDWVRPGDVLAGERAEQAETAAAIPDLPQAEGDAPQVFFGPEGQPSDWHWRARLVVVFADTAQDPAYLRQMRVLEGGTAALIDRETVVVADTDPAANGAWRQVLRPEGFSLILIDKDGTVMLRKPAPWDMREISRAIDRFPQRRQELRRGGLMP